MASLQLSHHLASTVTQRESSRRHELDWLRALIIIGLIPFHVVGLFMVSIATYVEGGQSSALVDTIQGFFGLWPMSLLFLVAGAGTWFALGRRTTGQYVRERLLRLFVPFLFATLIIIPIQVYAVISAYPQLLQLPIIPGLQVHSGASFLAFYPLYLEGYAYFLTHFTSMRELVFWGHIWFIPRLLLYALATTPLLLWLRGTHGQRFIAAVSRLFAMPGSILLLGLTLALPRILAGGLYRLALDASPTISWDPFNLWAQLGVFLICFLLGYLFYESPHVLAAVRRDGLAALALGIGLFALLQTPVGHLAPVTQFTPARILLVCLRSESEWLLVVGVLALGLRFFTAGNAVLEYLNEAAYPLYVLHMPVLIVVGLGLTQSGLPLMIALPIIVMATLALTLGLYEFVIKHIGVLRFLFGLKPPPQYQTTDGAGRRSMPDVGHRPDDQDDGGVAEPMGQR